MIAVDTSALAAIALSEDEEEVFSGLIASEDVIVGTPSLVELSTALTRLGGERADRFISRLIKEADVKPVDFSYAMYEVAKQAWRSYGKGYGHPAKLNFGDCLSYAVAKSFGIPLLYKGNDFSQTDLDPVWRP